MPELRLPLGALLTADGAPPRIDLYCVGAARRTMRNWFDRLSMFGLPWLSLPSTIAESAAGLALEYPASLRRGVPLGARLAEWSQDMAVGLPQVLELARFTLVVADGLAQHGFAEAPICPGLLYWQPGDSMPWRLLAIPAESATLADWSKADVAAWAWAAPDALLAGGRTNDPVFTLGAALHHGLIGTLFPELLHRHEQFARFLRGRVGMPALLEATLQSATPARCRSDAVALAKLTLECLDHPPRRLAQSEARARFESLEARLSRERLAGCWDAERRPAVGEKLRRQKEAPPPTAEPTDILPSGSKDWVDLAREHLERRDVSTALALAWNGLVADGPHKADLYLMVVQRSAAAISARAEVAAAVTRLVQTYSAVDIGESNLLRLAHIRVRYLGAQESDVASLLVASQSDWGRGLGLLLRAVFAVRKDGAYVETSRLCAAGRKGFAGMPQGGGVASRYAQAYLDLLDGVAHVGFVASGGPPDYYADALNRFGNALQLAAEIGADALRRAAAHWLRWLRWLAGLTAGPSASALPSAVEVLLRLHGENVLQSAILDAPEVPPYDESYLFPV